MSKRPMELKYLWKIAYISSLTALAVVLRFFEIPYPLLPFLKYDISGAPLALLAFGSIKYALAALPAYYIIPIAMGSDAVGMMMKVVAETSTFIPLAFFVKKFAKREWAAIAISSLSRSITMSALNLLVTPYWLLMAGWMKSYEAALSYTIAVLPHIFVFNLTIAIIVGGLAVTMYKVVKGYIPAQ